MTTVVREIERKYDVTAAELPDLATMPVAAAVSPAAEEVLDAVYYDTPDLRLIRGGVTLRRRTGGADAGWHLKLPMGPGTRDELRLPLGQPGEAGAAGESVPQELAALVRGRVRGQELRPVVRMHTVRRRRQLLDRSGQVLADVAADTVSAALADGSGDTSWDELEVELVAGDLGLLAAADEWLVAAGARPAATGTKLERALGARLAAPAGPPGPPGPHAPAGDVVLGYLAEQAGAVIHYDPLVRQDRPDAVHQMRVATRRARSALQAFGDVVDRRRTRELRDELKWLATVLGRARDAEVLQALLMGELAAVPPELLEGPVAERINGYFDGELAQARADVLAALDGPRYFALLDALDALLGDPPLTPLASHRAGKVLARPVRRAARDLERAIEAIPGSGEHGPGKHGTGKHGPGKHGTGKQGTGKQGTGKQGTGKQGTGDGGAGGTGPGHGSAQRDRDAAIHEARKAAKRARYAAEAVLPALGREAARQAASSKQLQTILGDQHDSVVARELIVTLARQAHAAGEDTFSYGLIHERQACRARELERRIAV